MLIDPQRHRTIDEDPFLFKGAVIVQTYLAGELLVK